MAFGLFKKKNKEVKKDERYQTLKVKEVIRVAKESVNVVFEQPSGGFDYKPGQFITLIKEVGGKKIRRAYSLCTTPFIDQDPAVTVKRVPGGLMSNHINDDFKSGDEIEIMEPMGMFTTTYSESSERHVVFLGGGSGITPLYSIMRSVLLKEPKSKVSLVYGNRHEEYIIFKDQLEQLKADHPDRFELVNILEEDTKGIAAYVGRPTVEMVGEIVQKLNGDANTEYFICGPGPMMDILSNGLLAAGVAEAQIRMESFEAGKTSPSIIVDKPKEASGAKISEVTVLLEGEEFVLNVPKKETILDAALDEDIDMPYSCQSGLCTACRAKCIEGEIDQEDAEGLSAKEAEDGYVLLCVGKPISDKIRVEVG
ncbi:MAG: ferredoxin--NADP reductase [Cyclobacteriaceae bacterium]